MKKHTSGTQVTYGRTRVQAPHVRDRRKPARLVLLAGCVSIMLFCGVQIRRGMQRETMARDAVSVMAVQRVSGDFRVPTDSAPAGYLDGEWNLWEYLSDVLSALFAA